ncbi:MAG: hypothetical protein KJZ80_05760 [Hyphomicrobiaceae bacterium]|nr:hypothetical protein [Hyphomicrobiaceae bacterium]
MSRQAAPRLGLVKRDEKETRLKEFIHQHIEENCASTCLLVARSAESPVARTVLSMGAKASLKGFSMRAIFANLGTSETARIAEACRVSDWALQIRWARDLRLLEAHEQLVIGPATCWIGDCMRREPTSRDACELYASDCPDTGRRASLFFERLWLASEPVFERVATEAADACSPALVQPFEQIAAASAFKPGPRTPA